MPRFDRFRTEQIQTERQFFNERNCVHRDTKPTNLASHRLSRVVSFIQTNTGHYIIWLAFCAVYIVRKRPEGQIMYFFFKHPNQIKLNQNNTFLKWNNKPLIRWYIRTYYMLNHRIRCINFIHFCRSRMVFGLVDVRKYS